MHRDKCYTLQERKLRLLSSDPDIHLRLLADEVVEESMPKQHSINLGSLRFNQDFDAKAPSIAPPEPFYFLSLLSPYYYR